MFKYVEYKQKMNINIRNFLRIIRRYNLAVVLNILGLSVAFAAFMMIMMQLQYDYSFDKFHKDYDKIYRVEFIRNTSAQANMCRPLADRFMESSPHILVGGIAQMRLQNTRFYVQDDDGRNMYDEKSVMVTSSFFDVFNFDFMEGSNEGFIDIESGNIFIPLSMAHKLFGKEPAVGKQIMLSSGGPRTIKAVYRDFPANSAVDNLMYLVMREGAFIDDRSEWSFITYIRVDESINAPLLVDNFKRNYDGTDFWGDTFNWDEAGISLRLTPLADLHYITGVEYDFAPKANKQMLMILFVIAIVIIAIAAINFTNFSTALTPMRVKNINTQRILGARRKTLLLSIASEAVVVCLLSYLIAILFVIVFNNTSLSKLIDADSSIKANLSIVGGTAVIALFSGLIAGLYPAFYITSFAPALVLKGNFGLSPKGNRLRNTLIGIQYIASFALIIGASFMYLQNYFMQHAPLGYDKDELITVDIISIYNSREAFINQIKLYSGIEDVTYGESLLSSADNYMGWGLSYKGKGIQFQSLPVHYTFLKVMGIEITEGRDFRAEDHNTQTGMYVFNETARKQFDMEIGTRIESGIESIKGEIIGFVPNIKFASFRNAVSPMAFYVWGTEYWGDRAYTLYIRVKANHDKRAAISHIRATLAEFDTENTFNIRFYNEILQRLYEKEITLNTLITLFSMLAIFISIVGVFGLVMFDSECRRKEIGIRKVLGASVLNIIIRFNKAYFRILLICFVIAAPLAWYAVNRWLENFAYKTPLYWWVYLLAFVTVGIITVATVTFQNWRVANEDPVNVINRE